MKKWGKDTVMIGAFVLLIGGMALANLLHPDSDFSVSENRALRTFPDHGAKAVFSGRFGSDFDAYVSDQFIGRDAWVGTKTLTQLLLVKKDNGRVYFGRGGTLFEKDDAVDDTRFQKNIDAVRAFLEKLEAERPEVTRCVLMAPTAAAVTPERLPAFAPVAPQEEMLQTLEKSLSSTAVFCNPLESLRREAGMPLYYRTDHHWTTAGAYTAYTAWAEAMGLSAMPMGTITVETVSDSFLGTLYSKANQPFLKPDTIERYRLPGDAACTRSSDGGKTVIPSLYDPEALNQKDQYVYFLGGNQPLVEIRTGTENGRTLLLLKDSYAHAFVPFLTAHYEKIVMVDLRYYKAELSTLMEGEQVTDLLFLYNVTNFAGDKVLASML